MHIDVVDKNGKRFNWQTGQSLIEVLIGLVVGALMVGAVVAIISPVLQIDTQTSRAQIGGALAKELLDSVEVWAESNWHNVDALATTSVNAYYLTTSTAGFSSSTGAQNVIVASATYSRYFYLDDVWRESGAIVNATSALSVPDPSTKLITVVYRWPPSSTASVSAYLTRSRNNFFLQTDWSGGRGSSTRNQFETSSRVTATGTGSIVIQGF